MFSNFNATLRFKFTTKAALQKNKKTYPLNRICTRQSRLHASLFLLNIAAVFAQIKACHVNPNLNSTRRLQPSEIKPNPSFYCNNLTDCI